MKNIYENGEKSRKQKAESSLTELALCQTAFVDPIQWIFSTTCAWHLKLYLQFRCGN